MAKFHDRPKFFRDHNGKMQQYLYCSCCISRTYLPTEENIEIFYMGGDAQKIYYCKTCMINKKAKHLAFNMPGTIANNDELEIQNDLSNDDVTIETLINVEPEQLIDDNFIKIKVPILFTTEINKNNDYFSKVENQTQLMNSFSTNNLKEKTIKSLDSKKNNKFSFIGQIVDFNNISKNWYVIIVKNAIDNYHCRACGEDINKFIDEMNNGRKIQGMVFPPFNLVYKRQMINERSAKLVQDKIRFYAKDKKTDLILKDPENECNIKKHSIDS